MNGSNQNEKNKIVVVGAGFAGLSAACLLAKDGYEVTVLEKNSTPGGRARSYSDSGYTFDMGPSWYLMPDVFEKFFGIFGKKPEDFFELVQLEPSYRIFFDDSVVDISGDLEKNLKLFDKFEKNGAEKLKRYLSEAKLKYEVAMREFINKDYSNIFDLVNWDVLSKGPKLTLFTSLDKYASKIFDSDKAKKILQYNVVFLGGNPKNTPAIYSLMAHVDLNMGVWYPMGGLISVVEALYKLGKSLGIEYKFGQEVTGINVTEGKADKVITKDAEYGTDLIVNTADYAFSETQLLPKKYQTYNQRYWEKRTLAPSGYMMFLGLDKKVKKLAHHNLMLDKDWTRHFDEIFEKPGWPENPSYYVSCPTKTDESIAPKGKDIIFVLVPVASDLNDSNEIREKYFDWVVTSMENYTGEQIKDHIQVKRIYTHRDFISDYHAYKGTALGLAHTLFQTAIFRPSNKSKKVSNLYYAGQFTNPGIGVPMALISAEIVRDLVKKNHGK